MSYEDEFEPEIVDLEILENQIGTPYCLVTIRMSKKEGSKLNLGLCSVNNVGE